MMDSETKYRVLMFTMVFSLFLFPLMLSGLIGETRAGIFSIIWYVGFIWLFLLKSKTGKSLLTRFDDWLHKICGDDWYCNSCGAKYNWKERQPILSFMIQRRVGYYTPPIFVKLCHLHFETPNDIKKKKSEVDESVKREYNIQWARDGSFVPDWFTSTPKEVNP